MSANTGTEHLPYSVCVRVCVCCVGAVYVGLAFALDLSGACAIL